MAGAWDSHVEHKRETWYETRFETGVVTGYHWWGAGIKE